MTREQKWAIVGAIWVAAIGIFLSAFRRYDLVTSTRRYGDETREIHSEIYLIDRWTGHVWQYNESAEVAAITGYKWIRLR